MRLQTIGMHRQLIDHNCIGLMDYSQIPCHLYPCDGACATLKFAHNETHQKQLIAVKKACVQIKLITTKGNDISAAIMQVVKLILIK